MLGYDGCLTTTMMYPDEPPEVQQRKTARVEVELPGRELRGSGRSLFFCPGITVLMLCVLGLLAIGVSDTDGNMPHSPQHGGMSTPLTQYVDSFGEEGKVQEERKDDLSKNDEELEPPKYVERERPHGVHSLNVGLDNHGMGYHHALVSILFRGLTVTREMKCMGHCSFQSSARTIEIRSIAVLMRYRSTRFPS